MSQPFVYNSIRYLDGTEIVIAVPSKVAEYFGIIDNAKGFSFYTRNGYTYTRLTSLVEGTKTTVTVPRHRSTKFKNVIRQRGRKIRIPTESFTKKGFPKTMGITFPQKVWYVEIGSWLWNECKLHKPEYFITEAGKHRPVAP
jgi:hypothetical protein